jgi:hypothetical protein
VSCRQSDASQSLVDEDGRATALLEEFDTVYSQQCATQTQMKENQARIQSLVQNSSVMNDMSASDTVFDFDTPADLNSQRAIEVPVFPPGLHPQTELFDSSLHGSQQSGGEIGPFLPDDAETTTCEVFAAGCSVPSMSISAAGHMMELHPGMTELEHQPYGPELDAWGLWEQRSMPADAHSPHSSAGESLGAIGRYLWGDEDGQHAVATSRTSFSRNSVSLRQDHDSGDCGQLSDGTGELAPHAATSLAASTTDDAVPSVSGTEQQLGLKDIVRVRALRSCCRVLPLQSTLFSLSMQQLHHVSTDWQSIIVEHSLLEQHGCKGCKVPIE